MSPDSTGGSESGLNGSSGMTSGSVFISLPSIFKKIDIINTNHVFNAHRAETVVLISA
jgi:hypothetical protein